ncbi:MAG TPA: response regulator, partial [Prosthecobacter sp.]|nr:response regulator [Prosthecobacter sp.]
MHPPLIAPNRRILVVDDNRDIHKDFRKILGAPEEADAELDALEAEFFGGRESVWFEIDTASQGDEGLRKIQQSLGEGRPYALAFVDVRMPPGWDGIETTRRMWEVDPHLQIVICTAYSDYSWTEIQAQTAPGDRMLILKKPFISIEVQQLAKTLTEKWRLGKEDQMKLIQLDRMVERRTAELTASQAAALDLMEEAMHHLEQEKKLCADLMVQMEERQKLEAKFQYQASLLDKARDAILVRDMDHRISFWNKGAEMLYGWTAEEAVGSPVSQLLHANEKCCEEAELCVMRDGEWIGEIKQVAKDGRTVLVESRWTLVRDGDGNAKAVMTINTDVTEKKKMESHVLRCQRMESLGTLAGGIAHDLNNVLLPIMMSIDLLKLSVKKGSEARILTSMEGSTRRGADMVRQVLAFARGVEGERHQIELKDIVREIEHLVKETFPKNIQFRTEVPEDLPTFLGDATQVHQVLLNLCVNARDAMPGGGKLTVSARRMTHDESSARKIPEAKTGDYVVLTVADNGTGISSEVREMMFEPFFTTKELGKGTGLGLSTTLAIVKSHGGYVTVYSELDQGTVFHVHFPVDAAPAGGVPPCADGTLPRGGGELILVVEDDEVIRSVTRQTLETFGYRVITAKNGADSIAMYAEHQQDVAVVLTDMMMPVMDGTTTMRTLKRMNPKVKIIAASGLNTGAGSGADAFLLKPYTAPAMLKALDRVLHDDGEEPTSGGTAFSMAG